VYITSQRREKTPVIFGNIQVTFDLPLSASFWLLYIVKVTKITSESKAKGEVCFKAPRLKNHRKS